MSKKSFHEILFLTLRLSVSHPLFFVFAACVLVPTTTLFLPYSLARTLQLLDPLLSRTGSIFFLDFLFCLLFSLWIFGKSNLFVLLHIQSEKKFIKHLRLFHVGKNFLSALYPSLFFLIINISILLTLSIPLFFFWSEYHTFPLPLLILTFATLFPLSLFIFLIEEFALLYILLSRIPFRDALENSARIFSDHLLPCISYTVLFYSILTVFTFLANLAMLGITALLAQLVSPETVRVIFIGGAFVFVLWLTILKHAFSLLLFQDIATPPNRQEKDRKESLLPTPLEDVAPPA